MAKEINTYDEAIKALTKGTYVNSSQLRNLSKPLYIHKLELDDAARESLLHIIHSIEGDQPAPGTTEYTGLQNIKTAAAGGLVNWNTLETIFKALGRNSDHEQIGHKDLSVLRILLAELEKNFPPSKIDKRLQSNYATNLKKLHAIVQHLDDLDKDALRELGRINTGAVDMLNHVVDTLNENYEIDIGVKGNTAAISGKEYQSVVTVEFEDKQENQLKGKVSAQIGKYLLQYFNGNDKSIQKVLDRVSVDIHGSPRAIDDIDEIIFETFKKGSSRNFKRKSKKRSRTKHKNKRISGKTVTNPFRKAARNFKPSAKGRVPDMGMSIHVLLNAVLPAYVKDQMGSPEDPPIKLRNQTGRFAESVEAVGTTQTRSGAINVLYTYMRYPYDTFLPGGRLYTPERDPSAFVPIAIREAATHLISSRLRITAELVE